MSNYDLGTAEGKIVLDSSGVDNAVQQANQSLGRLGKGVQSAERVGRDLTLGVTAPIVAMGGYALKTAIDFETAFAGVTKTVSATDSQIADLRQGIIDMSLEIPASTTEIAGVAEAAGQLGIAVDDIEEFTRVMVDLGVATNLSSTEAADSIAHVTNIMGTGVEDFGRFGAALVGLGNDSAATEGEILEMGNRIAGIANLTGSSEAEMLSLAAALSSVGVNAESGGTSVTKTLKDFDEWTLAIQESGGAIDEMDSKARAFYELIGGQAAFEEFVPLNGIQRFDFFIKKMQEAEAGGGNLISILKDMGLQEIRQSDAVLRMVGAGDLLSRTLEVGNQAWEENTALTNEAGKRYETTASQLQIARNKADNAARIFGEALIPVLIDLLDAITPLLEGVTLMAEAFAALPDGVRQAIVLFLVLAAALGPFIWIGARIVRTFMALSGAIRLIAGGFKILSLAMAANPFVLLILAIVAIIAAFYLLYTRSEKFRNFINGLGEDIKRIWGSVVDFFKGLPDFFRDLWSRIEDYFNTAKEAVVGAWGDVKDFFADIGSAIADAFNTAKDAVVDFVTNAASEVGDFFSSLPGIIAGGLQTAANAFVDFLTKLPERWAYAFGFILGRTIRLFIDLWQATIQGGLRIWNAVTEFLGNVIMSFITWALDMWQLTIQFWNDLTQFIGDKAAQIVSFLIQKLGEFLVWLPGFLFSILSSVINWGISLVENIIRIGGEFVMGLINAIINLPGQVAGIVWEIISSFPGWASDFGNGAWDMGASFVDGLVNGIGDLVGLVRDMVLGAINGVSDLGQTAYNKMKSIGSSMWNGFKDGLFGSPHTKVEYAVWDMTANVDTAVSTLAAQVRTMQSLSRSIPLTAQSDRFGTLAAIGPSSGVGAASSGAPGSLGAGVQHNYNAPLIGEAVIRREDDIYELANDLENERTRRNRGRGQ